MDVGGLGSGPVFLSLPYDSGGLFSHPTVLQVLGNFWNLVKIKSKGKNKLDGERKEPGGKNLPTF